MDGDRALTWRTSSYSGNNGGQCVEIAARETVLVRDSKDSCGPVLEADARVWQEFITRLKASVG
jgi:hypothetical protein